MESIFNITGKIATPLALAGFFGAVLFFTLHRILQAHFIGTVRRLDSVRILLRIINLLFILCLAGMLFGFTGYLLRLRVDNPGIVFTNSLQHQVEPILGVKLLLRIGGYRINVLNSGTTTATDAYVDVVSWRPGAPGPDAEKTIPIHDLPPYADITFDVSFLSGRDPHPEPDFTNTYPTCGYIAVACVGANRPRAWAFYIPNADDHETYQKFFQVEPWPIVEFQYPEDKPGIGCWVDYPKGVCPAWSSPWNAKDTTHLNATK
jgi:hypothetical protein